MQLGHALYSILAKGRSSGERMLWKDERGQFQILLVGIVALLALFGIGIGSAISLKFLIGIFAMGILGMSFIGVVFFKADPKLILLALIATFAIITFIELTIPMVIGLLIFAGIVWQLKLLAKKPTILIVLVAAGLLIIIAGQVLVLQPMGIAP